MAMLRDTELRVKIGQNLMKGRKLAGLDQDAVMLKLFGHNKEVTGRTANRVSEWEHGIHLPDAEMLCQLCKIYSVSADYILGLSAEPEIDATAGRAGLLYNGLTEVLSSSVQDMVTKLSLNAALYMQSLPAAPQLHLVDLCRQLGTVFLTHKDKLPVEVQAAVMDILPVVREIEKLQAIKFSQFANAVENLADPDETENLIAQLDHKRLKRFPASVLPTEYKQDMQLGLLPSPTE